MPMVSGNSAPSLVSCCQSSSLHCGEFVDTYNLATRKTRGGFFNSVPPSVTAFPEEPD